ncbi:hypothetical protein BaRGS_00001285, partial [Batillaria attramentaria]
MSSDDSPTSSDSASIKETFRMFFPEKMFYTHRYRQRPVLRRYSSLIVLPCSLKQIPFTVPTAHVNSPGYRRTELSTKSLDEGSMVGGSEPTTPTGKRPSVEIPVDKLSVSRGHGEK